MKGFIIRLLSALLAIAFTVFWLIVLDWILTLASHLIWRLPETAEKDR
jgi:hypothetical protein